MWTLNVLVHEEMYRVMHIEFPLLEVNRSYCALTKLQLMTKVHELFPSAAIEKKKIFSEIKHSKHRPPPLWLYEPLT